MGVFRSVSGIVTVSDPYMFASSRLRFASTPATTIAGNQYEAVKLALKAPPYDINSPRFCFGAFYCKNADASETSFGNDVLIEGVSISIGGVITPLTLSGTSSNYTLTNGSYAWTDANTLVIPANSTYYLLYSSFVATGGVRPNNSTTLQTSTDGYNASSTTQVARLTSGSFTSAARGGSSWGPCAMVAKGWKAAGKPPVPLVVGDSVGWGQNDTNIFTQPDGIFGYVNKGLWDNASSTRYAFGNFCIPGTKFTNLAATTNYFSRREAILRSMNLPFTSILSEMGINSLVSSSAQWIADCTAAATYLKTLGSKKLIQLTLTPSGQDTGNGGGSTVASQTGSAQFGANDYLMGEGTYVGQSPAVIDAVIDNRTYFRDSVTTNAWKSTGYVASLQADVSSGTTISLDVAPNIDAFLVIGVGLSTKIFRKVYSVSGTGPYTVTLNTAITGTHTAGEVVRSSYVDSDLVHPTTEGANLGAGAIIAAKNAGTVFV